MKRDGQLWTMRRRNRDGLNVVPVFVSVLRSQQLPHNAHLFSQCMRTANTVQFPLNLCIKSHWNRLFDIFSAILLLNHILPCIPSLSCSDALLLFILSCVVAYSWFYATLVSFGRRFGNNGMPSWKFDHFQFWCCVCISFFAFSAFALVSHVYTERCRFCYCSNEMFQWLFELQGASIHFFNWCVALCVSFFLARYCSFNVIICSWKCIKNEIIRCRWKMMVVRKAVSKDKKRFTKSEDREKNS